MIPVEAIDQFSLQAAGEADQGCNGGANSNMVLRTGTNQLHGDVFHFDRNELFAWLSPSVAVGSRIPEIRNHQGGFTSGGPIWKDKTFFFVAGEVQIAQANNSLSDTVLNDTWISIGQSLLASRGITQNQVALNLYTLLFPALSRTSTGYSNQYQSNGVNTYNSYNGIIKLDHNFNDKYSITAHYLSTTGAQSADVGSHFADYFEAAPMHIHNFQIAQNSTFNSKLVNQVTAAAQSFLQVFDDRNQGFDVETAGLNLGLTGVLAKGAPQLYVGSFDYTGATPPLGRQDVTGHIDDTLYYSVGRHELKFGGEYRHANLNVAYFVNGRGTFNFEGTRYTNNGAKPVTQAECTAAGLDYTNVGPNKCSTGIQVADLVAGLTRNNASGATILRNNPRRVFLVNTFDLFAADDYKVNSRLTLNYGVRWTYPGTVSDDRNSLYSFTPEQEYFKAPLYARNLGNVAPRFGFAFTPFSEAKTVLRGGFGWFFDQPTVGRFVYNSVGNGASAGIYGTPGDTNAAITVNCGATFALDQSSFPTGLQFGANGEPTTSLGLLVINPNYRAAYMQNYNLNVEQQLARNTLLTITYAGSVGRRLAYVADLNQVAVTRNATERVRPYASQYPYLTAINQVNSGATSNYNSLQATMVQSQWHGLSASLLHVVQVS